jgi:hypothetical protein
MSKTDMKRFKITINKSIAVSVSFGKKYHEIGKFGWGEGVKNRKVKTGSPHCLFCYSSNIVPIGV